MAKAFEYYGRYKNNSNYQLISDRLLISAKEWKSLGNLVTEISFKKEKQSDLAIIIEKLERIKKIELEAMDKLKDILSY